MGKEVGDGEGRSRRRERERKKEKVKLMNMHIDMWKPDAVRKTIGPPPPAFRRRSPQRDANFPLRPRQGRSAGGSRSAAERPSIGQTGSGAASARPHGDSHEFPQFQRPPLAGYSIQRRTGRCPPAPPPSPPSNAAIKGMVGGGRGMVGS